MGDLVTQDINAAGRVLSSKTLTHLQAVLASVTDAMKQLQKVLNESVKEPSTDTGPDVISNIEAGRIAELSAEFKWIETIRSLFESLFSVAFDLALADDSDDKGDRFFRQYLDEGEKPSAGLIRLIDEFVEVLTTLCITERPESIPEHGGYFSPARARRHQHYDDYGSAVMAAADHSDDQPIEAGKSLKDTALRSAWRKLFGQYFCILDQHLHQLLFFDLESFKNITTEAERAEAIKVAIAEFGEVLKEHCQIELDKKHIGGWIEAKAAPNANDADAETVAPAISGAEGDTAADAYPENTEINAAISVSSLVACYEPVAVAPEELSEFPVNAAAHTHNLRPIRGSLLRVDEPSEAPPLVGPGLPLYIPRAVAEAALNVAHLPLEAAADLRSHDKRSTCGVMTSAEILGNDFWVDGYVWPYNHEEKIEQISASNGELGMSMNASAAGRVAVVAGQKVFWIEKLKLLGGCILRHDSATYQQTRVNLAASGAVSPEIPSNLVAASAGQTQELGETTVDQLQEIQASLKTYAASVEQMSNTLSNAVSKIESSVSALEKRIDGIEQIEAARAAEVQASSSQQQQEAQQRLMVEAVSGAFSEQIETLKKDLPGLVEASVDRKLDEKVNPRRVPARNTMSVVEAAGGDSSNLSTLQVELIEARSALSALRRTGSGDTAERVRLADRISELERQGIA